ncbi:MerR family transcriptional regulator [Limosilactobacillus sp.]|jgi:DNA-binding transcriptional MerR regulator|uniref:MerR family transcriptional regulator n=1 Tax=Limosilactobacillus sp. TaxID=2773925 RepID=UPI0025BFC56A|nr:MerR family transcriptional regulator [Limosilactobacillus sp.]MCH3921296.1 MerR family transcriptional regulator [Limosilactobacillus sp.]MCH3928067.1 MerR family transcriptional regulator [Limosilactobacillus sp.]
METLTQRFRRLFVNSNLRISMTELAKETGVSPRQIRYWERKGYIHSDQDAENANHRFGLVTICRVITIKYFLDQGYTLAKAAEYEQQHRLTMKIFRQFLADRIENIQQVDSDSGEVDLGPLDDDPTQEVYALIKDGQTSIHLRPRRQ